MLFSGTSWGPCGYEVALVDSAGQLLGPTVRFGLNDVHGLIAHLRGVPQPHVTVIDSTNGVLDGLFLAAGLNVSRADPSALIPVRPVLGSVSAGDLAGAAHRQPSAVTRLEVGKGVVTGRDAEMLAGIAAGSTALDQSLWMRRAIVHGARDRAEIALTFDDGPLRPYTGHILDILEHYEIRATFFCTGLMVGAGTEDIARMQKLGHEVGNHTWSHPYLPDLSPLELVKQLGRTQESITAAGGPAPKLFRPPYGSFTTEMADPMAVLEQRVVLWDVTADDWALEGAGVVTRKVLDHVQPGSVVLMHDGGGNRSQTVAALPGIIEGVLQRGLRPVPVGELSVTPLTKAPPRIQ